MYACVTLYAEVKVKKIACCCRILSTPLRIRVYRTDAATPHTSRYFSSYNLGLSVCFHGEKISVSSIEI
jgi:hypothetical protein